MKHILTITGPSGAGKDTLLDALLVRNGIKDPKDVSELSAMCYAPTKVSLKVSELISHTTRSPRKGEVEGVDYYYIDLPTFNSLEKVEETEYAGNHYCLSANELHKLKDGEWGAVVVDQHGVECIRKFVNAHPDEFTLTTVFLHISSYMSEHRMRMRGDKPENIERRLKQQAIRHEYYPNNPDTMDYILMSDNVRDVLDNVETLQTAMAKVLRDKD